MLQNFPSYLKNLYSNRNILLEEMNKFQFYKAKGRPPYSTQMIRFALLLCYTSSQAYRLLLEYFSFPSIPLLKRLRKGNVDAIKAAKLLLEKNEIDKNIILMIDEMYLRKCAQYSGGDFIGTDTNRNLFKGIVVFMIQGIKIYLVVV